MRRPVIAAILVVQVLCAVFFVAQILSSVVGLPFAPISWEIYELIEIGAAVGLLLGIVFLVDDGFKCPIRNFDDLTRQHLGKLVAANALWPRGPGKTRASRGGLLA